MATAKREILGQSVDVLNIGVRGRKAMMRVGIKTLGQLVKRSFVQARSWRNFGATSLCELERELSAHGLSLAAPGRDAWDQELAKLGLGPLAPRRAPSAKWQSAPGAARRLGRNAGHVRKRCPGWQRKGLARRVSGGGKRWRWQVRSDATLPRPARQRRGRAAHRFGPDVKSWPPELTAALAAMRAGPVPASTPPRPGSKAPAREAFDRPKIGV